MDDETFVSVLVVHVDSGDFCIVFFYSITYITQNGSRTGLYFLFVADFHLAEGNWPVSYTHLFLQRAVDQMLHDVCMQKLHVIFAVDRAGLVGADGETHQGNFDISYLSMMPGMTVMAPKNDWELKEMLRFAVKADGPVAIRYPRGNAYQGLQEYQTAVELSLIHIFAWENGKQTMGDSSPFGTSAYSNCTSGIR